MKTLGSLFGGYCFSPEMTMPIMSLLFIVMTDRDNIVNRYNTVRILDKEIPLSNVRILDKEIPLSNVRILDKEIPLSNVRILDKNSIKLLSK